MIEQEHFSCAGYVSTCGYASKIRLRVPVFGVFCREDWMLY